MSRVLPLLLTGSAIVWAIALIAAPLSPPRSAPAAAGALVYAAGGLVCHQQPQRSFQLRGIQLPVCARCTALYLAGAAGAAVGWAGRARRILHPRRLLALTAMPVALTVGLEWAGAAAPGNLVRALSAIPIGGTAGWLFVRMLRAESAAGQMGYDARV